MAEKTEPRVIKLRKPKAGEQLDFTWQIMKDSTTLKDITQNLPKAMQWSDTIQVPFEGCPTGNKKAGCSCCKHCNPLNFIGMGLGVSIVREQIDTT